jgi:hypothetical protein
VIITDSQLLDLFARNKCLKSSNEWGAWQRRKKAIIDVLLQNYASSTTTSLRASTGRVLGLNYLDNKKPFHFCTMYNIQCKQSCSHLGGSKHLHHIFSLLQLRELHGACDRPAPWGSHREHLARPRPFPASA